MPPLFKRLLRRFFRFIKPTLLVVVIFLFLLIFFRVILPLYHFAQSNSLSPGFIYNIALDKDLPIKKNQGRTNIIFLGIAGVQHEGYDLTDTIIFLSVDFSKKDIVMVSISRDVWLPSLKAKVNAAYHYGEKKKEGGGFILAKAAVEEVVGQPIHYAWLIDFSGFKRMIDLVGGIDVYVEKRIDDRLYPIPGKEDDLCNGDPTFSCRYEHLVFEVGQHHMDGETALKYVRSRNTEGEEGTDFARGRRTQQAILAFKDKILSLSLWKKPKLAQNLFDVFQQTTDTDMNWSEKIVFLKSFFQTPGGNIRRLTLDTGDDVLSGKKEEERKPGFLKNPPIWEYDGVWVLVPRTGNFDEIHKYIACHLENPSCSITP